MWHKDSAWRNEITELYQASGYGVCTFSDGIQLNGYFQVSCTEKATMPKANPEIKYEVSYDSLVEMKLELKGQLPKLEIVSFDFKVDNFKTQDVNSYRNYLEALVQSHLHCRHTFAEPFILKEIDNITSVNLELSCQLTDKLEIYI